MWEAFDIKSTEDLDAHLNNFRVQFAFHSAKIENSGVTFKVTREIFEDDVVQKFTGSPDTLTEISNQRKCHSFLLSKTIAKEPITIELIKAAHEITTMGTYDDRRYFVLNERPGEFKKNDFVVGRHDVGSLPEMVETDMLELLQEISEVQNLSALEKVLKAATYFHAKFEYIHPFADGNGRVGRTMMNYFLMLLNHPPLIVFEDEKFKYYEALEQYAENEDVESLYVFFLHCLERTWYKILE